MSPFVVASCYFSALALAVALLWYFGARAWYWHVLSVGGAIAIGLTPLPEAWNTPGMTLTVGWVFLLLLVWGIVAPVFSLAHHQPHFRTHSR